MAAKDSRRENGCSSKAGKLFTQSRIRGFPKSKPPKVPTMLAKAWLLFGWTELTFERCGSFWRIGQTSHYGAVARIKQSLCVKTKSKEKLPRPSGTVWIGGQLETVASPWLAVFIQTAQCFGSLTLQDICSPPSQIIRRQTKESAQSFESL